jgi:hypothetical protein
MSTQKQKKEIIISVILIISILFIMIYPAIAEDTVISPAGTSDTTTEVITGTTSITPDFKDECEAGIKQQGEWDQTYDNGYGSKIRIFMIEKDYDPADASIYNTDLNERDMVIIFNKIQKKLFILYGNEVDRTVIMKSEEELKKQFQDKPCRGFQKFIEVVSKKEILKEQLSAFAEFDCATAFLDAEKTWENNVYGGSETKYETIYQNCMGNIYGLRAALILGKHYADNNAYKTEALEHYQEAYDNSLGYEDIRREALYGLILSDYKSSNYDKTLEEIREYKESYSTQSSTYDEKLKEIEKRCNDLSETVTHCKELYPIASGNKLNIIFITDSDISSEEFAQESKDIIEQGLFSEPFLDSIRNKFAIYYIDKHMSSYSTDALNRLETDDTIDPATAGITEKFINIGLQGEINKISESCPSGTKVLISDNSFGSFSYTGRNTIILSKNQIDAKNTAPPPIHILFKHEFGHAAFNLQDEYTIAGYDDRPGIPNCFNTREEAKIYWERTLGLREGTDFNYYNGCSYTQDNIRGTQTSIMKSDVTSPDYGPINEAYIKMFMDKYD